MSQDRIEYHAEQHRRAGQEAKTLDRVYAETDWVRHRQQWMATGFIAVPNLVWRSPALTFGAKAVYVELLSYSWQDQKCFPSIAAMCRHLGITEPTLRAYLKELEQAELVSVERRGLGLTSLYWLEPLTDRLAEHLNQTTPKTRPERKNFSPGTKDSFP
jgi:hypothetical protein